MGKIRIDKEEIKERIQNKVLKISVVGLGYVGLNVACLFAKNGFAVYGFDTNQKRIEKLKNNVNPLPEEEWLNPYISKLLVSMSIESAALKGDVVFIAVPTPFCNNKTDLSYLVSALTCVSKNLCEGKFLVIESTVPPGTTEGVVKNLIEGISGLKSSEDFGLAFSPERIDPGNKCRFIWNTPKIVGGIDPLSTEIISFLYSQVVDKIISVSTPRSAEFVKVIENAQRNVNIALTNLYSKIANSLGIDIEEALSAASTKWNFLRLNPGCGVGGECIECAANMLSEVMDRLSLDSTLIDESVRINRSMPEFTVNKLIEASNDIGKEVGQLRIGILGLAYKGDSSDTRNSPSLKIIKSLNEKGCRYVLAYDPFANVQMDVGAQFVKTLKEAIGNMDCVIIATDHTELKHVDVSVFKENNVKAIIDGRNCLNKGKVEALGIIYKGIGR